MFTFASKPISPCPLCLGGYCGDRRDFLPPLLPTKADWIGPSITEALQSPSTAFFGLSLSLHIQHLRCITTYLHSVADWGIIADDANVLQKVRLRLSSALWSQQAHMRISRSCLTSWDMCLRTSSLERVCVSICPTAEDDRDSHLSDQKYTTPRPPGSKYSSL